jgi:hypothetical protein
MSPGPVHWLGNSMSPQGWPLLLTTYCVLTLSVVRKRSATWSTVQSCAFLAPEWTVHVLRWSPRGSNWNFLQPQVAVAGVTYRTIGKSLFIKNPSGGPFVFFLFWKNNKTTKRQIVKCLRYRCRPMTTEESRPATLKFFFFFWKENESPVLHPHFTLANFSFVNLVFIFRCSRSTTNPVCERRVNLLVYSLSLHRHSYIGFILTFASSIHNKLPTLTRPKKNKEDSWTLQSYLKIKLRSHVSKSKLSWLIPETDSNCSVFHRLCEKLKEKLELERLWFFSFQTEVVGLSFLFPFASSCLLICRCRQCMTDVLIPSTPHRWRYNVTPSLVDMFWDHGCVFIRGFQEEVVKWRRGVAECVQAV